MTIVRELVLFVFRVVVGIIIVLNEILRPLYRPLMRWLSRQTFIKAIEEAIASLPAYVILVMLLVPIGIVEPLKFYGLLLLARGMLVRGVLITILGHLLSFVLIERIYQAGKPKLLTIRWFAIIVEWIALLRDRMMAAVKNSPLWPLVTGTRNFIARTFGDRGH